MRMPATSAWCGTFAEAYVSMVRPRPVEHETNAVLFESYRALAFPRWRCATGADEHPLIEASWLSSLVNIHARGRGRSRGAGGRGEESEPQAVT